MNNFCLTLQSREGQRQVPERNVFSAMLSVCFMLSLILPSNLVWADDIDVYYPEADAAPNVLFVVDASGSMGWTDGTSKTRMQRIQAALQLALVSMEGVKVGLMQFRSNNQAKLLLPIAPLDSTEFSGSQTHREMMQSAVNTIPTSGSTPTVAGLHEAALYFSGRPVSSEVPSANGALLDGVTPPTYRAPSFDGCNSSNYIVLMTDGQPTTRIQSGKVQSLIGQSCNGSNSPAFGSLERYLTCGRELTDAMAHKGSFNRFTSQPVYLFTVGLGIQGGDAWLQHFAERGRSPDIQGSNFFSLSGNASEQQLAVALQDIVRRIAESEIQSIAQPVPASNFQGIANKGDLYLGVYDVGPGEYWEGNVHKFRLGTDAVIYDANNNPAVGDDGFFKESALGQWTKSTARDGGSADVGGARENLPNANQRNIYTYLEASGTKNLTSTKNRFHVSNVKTNGNPNGLLTAAMFGVGNAQGARDLVEWALDGKLMDPLHTSVQLVTYNQNDESNTSYVFYGDNGGFFRALNANTGREVFSFIPEELLKNLEPLRVDGLGSRSVYGVDGPISVSINDKYGSKGVIDSDANGADSVHVYFGLRRGSGVGHIYALDITNINTPKLLWRISSGDTGFNTLGQTWSRLVKTQVLMNGSITPVLLFGGGYDADKDDQTARVADNLGNSLFMINSETGALLWSAGSAAGHTESISQMRYSIPGSLRVIDLDRDGLADRFYFGDTGGQLWRCTINGGASLSDLIDCGIMLKAAGDGASEDRRFFETPDVSTVNIEGEMKLAVAMGTGNRANPKDIGVDGGLRDRFFVVHDSPKKDAAAPTNLTASDLFDTTTKLYDRNTATSNEQNEIKNGWYITLRPGEKVYSSAATYEGVTYFSTYKYIVSADQCSIGEGDSRLYSVVKATGQPSQTSIGGTPSLGDRHITLDTAAIPVSPSVFRVADGSGVLAAKGAQVCVGLECIYVSGGRRIEAGHFQSDH